MPHTRKPNSKKNGKTKVLDTAVKRKPRISRNLSNAKKNGKEKKVLTKKTVKPLVSNNLPLSRVTFDQFMRSFPTSFDWTELSNGLCKGSEVDETDFELPEELEWRCTEEGSAMAAEKQISPQQYLQNVSKQICHPQSGNQFLNTLRSTQNKIHLAQSGNDELTEGDILHAENEIVAHMKHCGNRICWYHFMDFKQTRMFQTLKGLWLNSGQSIEAFLMDVVCQKETAFHYVMTLYNPYIATGEKDPIMTYANGCFAILQGTLIRIQKLDLPDRFRDGVVRMEGDLRRVWQSSQQKCGSVRLGILIEAWKRSLFLLVRALKKTKVNSVVPLKTQKDTKTQLNDLLKTLPKSRRCTETCFFCRQKKFIQEIRQVFQHVRIDFVDHTTYVDAVFYANIPQAYIQKIGGEYQILDEPVRAANGKIYGKKYAEHCIKTLGTLPQSTKKIVDQTLQPLPELGEQIQNFDVGFTAFRNTAVPYLESRNIDFDIHIQSWESYPYRNKFAYLCFHEFMIDGFVLKKFFYPQLWTDLIALEKLQGDMQILSSEYLLAKEEKQKQVKSIDDGEFQNIVYVVQMTEEIEWKQKQYGELKREYDELCKRSLHCFGYRCFLPDDMFSPLCEILEKGGNLPVKQGNRFLTVKILRVTMGVNKNGETRTCLMLEPHEELCYNEVYILPQESRTVLKPYNIEELKTMCKEKNLFERLAYKVFTGSKNRLIDVLGNVGEELDPNQLFPRAFWR